METVRSFIALELAPEIQQELGRIQAELKKSDADVKWVKPDGIHLTLRFLGSVSLELVEEIKKLLDQLAKNHKRFAIKISGLGAFPKVEHPRVIWVGIEQGKEESLKLAKELEQGLVKHGFLPEKHSFKPHLTLGRVRSSRKREQLKQLLQSTNVSAQTMQAETLILFRSTLTPQGAIYQPLHQANLS